VRGVAFQDPRALTQLAAQVRARLLPVYRRGFFPQHLAEPLDRRIGGAQSGENHRQIETVVERRLAQNEIERIGEAAGESGGERGYEVGCRDRCDGAMKCGVVSATRRSTPAAASRASISDTPSSKNATVACGYAV
jgi:hypothetical protein